MELQDLSGKVAIITGASSGIGAATARALVAQGMNVALAARSAEPLAAVAAELGLDRALAVSADVTKGADLARLVQATLDRFGRIDVLFANAGIYIRGSLIEGDPEEWAHLIDVNVTGVLRSIHAVLPTLLAQGSGDIIVNASISGHLDIQWEPVYSASKHAVLTLVNILRCEVAERGIRAAAISPGMVLNPLWGVSDPQAIEEGVAAHRNLRSEDVADLVTYMLRMPPHITLRSVVALPQAQVL